MVMAARNTSMLAAHMASFKTDCRFLGGHTLKGTRLCEKYGEVSTCDGCLEAIGYLDRGPCRFRGDAVRQDISNICGKRGQETSVFACQLFSECSPKRYCFAQTVRICLHCDDHAEPCGEIKWLEPPPIEFTRTKRNLVVTVAIGEEFGKLLEITGPLMKKYADRVGADFIVITDKTQPWWGLEKFRVKPLVEAYERTLFVDADCIIRPSCCDLFEAVPSDKVGIHDDWLFNKSTDWAYGEWEQLMRSQGRNDPLRKRMLNTGVVVCSRQHANIWTPPTLPIPGIHCDEQFLIDDKIKDWHALPQACNHQFWFENFNEKLPKAEIVHLAACKTDRIGLARTIVSEITP